MIEHQLEALQSEAWGVSGEEHTLDYARRVREFLKAQEFETGCGSLDLLPDIVQHVCGHAEAIERRRAEPIPWQDLLRKYVHEMTRMTPTDRAREFIKHPYFSPFFFMNPEKFEYAFDHEVNDIVRAGNKEEDKPTWELTPPLVNRFIAIVPDTSGSMDFEAEREYWDDKYGKGFYTSPNEKSKSEIIKEMFEKEGNPIIDIVASPRGDHPEDFLGIPIVSDEHRAELRAKLGLSEKAESAENAVVFFDEFDPAKHNIERDNGDTSE